MQRNSIHSSVWSCTAFHAHLLKLNRCGKCFYCTISTQILVTWSNRKVTFLIEEKLKTRRSDITFFYVLLFPACLIFIILDAMLPLSEHVQTRMVTRERAAVRVPTCAG